MSHWCPVHPQYSAKKQPHYTCIACWQLYFLRCPEARPAMQQVYTEAKAIEPKTEER